MPQLGPEYDLARRLDRIERALSTVLQGLGQSFSSTQSDGTLGLEIMQDQSNQGATVTAWFQGPRTAVDPQTGQHPPLLVIGETVVGGVPGDSAVIGYYPSGNTSMTLGAGGLGIFDATNNVVFTPDQTAGQGLSRPYIPGVFYRSDYPDWPTVTGSAFATKYRARMPKQHPKLLVYCYASTDGTGTTGQVQVLVNGAVWGAPQSTGYGVGELVFGPLPVDGTHESDLDIEIQGCVTAGTGGIKFGPSRLEGRAS